MKNLKEETIQLNFLDKAGSNKRGDGMAFEIHDETKNKNCTCGCGEKAEIVMQIGEKTDIPLTNDCLHKMVLDLFSFAEKVKKNPMKEKFGSFKDRYGMLTDYGIADEDDGHSLIFFNEEKKKGIRIEWDDLYNFVKRTDINN
ncbi:MAG: hypothetical protein FWE22_00510 [Firmicutes bacterium]|nr:hypothetical protein [Bacillota bacterium]